MMFLVWRGSISVGILLAYLLVLSAYSKLDVYRLPPPPFPRSSSTRHSTRFGLGHGIAGLRGS